MGFSKFGLDLKILESLNIIDYKVPTRVQNLVIPQILDGKDVIVFEQTGMGKTAAFTIPLCQKVDWEKKSPQVLVLSPTRELAIQVSQEVENIGKLKRLRAQVVYGKQSFEKEQLNLKQKCHFVVATLGRLRDHIEKGTIDLSKVEYLVLDEFDELIQTGFLEDLEFIISKLGNLKQRIFVSATIPEHINDVINKYLKTPYIYSYQSDEENQTLNLIENYLIVKNDNLANKVDILKRLIVKEKSDRTIVFCNTQAKVEEVYETLRRDVEAVLKIHGDMGQKERIKALRDFNLHKKAIMIATNVVARGIHVEDVNLVVNFEVPFEKEKYTHRIGRTGRAGNEGRAVTLVDNTKLDIFLEKHSEQVISKYTLNEKENLENHSEFYSEFTFKNYNKCKMKENKSDVTKLYFRGGKNKKLRVVDFVGVICNIEGISAEDVGVIKVDLEHTTVDILNGKGEMVFQSLKDKNIKGKRIRVEIARR